jgi:hypothetical protein
VPLASVAARAGLKDFVLQKHVLWLSAGHSYRFQQWANDDVQFARTYADIFTTQDDFRGKLDRITPGLRVYRMARNGTDWTIRHHQPQLASQWVRLPEKNPADELRIDVAAMTKVWVSYGGARFEVAVYGYCRLLYDPKLDELIEVSVENLRF